MKKVLAMISPSAAETEKFGQIFAKNLRGGEVIGLIGELGSGKTAFVKGLAKGLGIQEPITSPTFVVLREYNILRPKLHLRGVVNMVRKLIHVDAYRLEKIEEIKSAGIEDYWGRKDAIMVIEWAEKIKKILPKNTIYIRFKHISENIREISIKKRTYVEK
ncbi:MAG TPA: tRNA (adenosine(37)-N6)-threonylcarbamoyltransferase complex ATPase subunit type 1 TsaE [Patescibacteria group bacterium]|nr:tRNA (adenosine(37)-N6)-threonylcarbamoyltransferase complex ATPase subunit type 1 TsaE [Patescibacteria group bacterium]